MIIINNFTARQKWLLDKLNIHSYEELLNYFPYKYVSYVDSNLNADCNGKRVVIRGIIVDKSKIITIKSNLKKYTISVEYKNQIVKVEIFNQEYLYEQVKLGFSVLSVGKYNYKRNEIKSYEVTIGRVDNIKLKPLYHLNNKIFDKEFRRFIIIAFNCVNQDFYNEVLPLELIKKYRLINKRDAYYNIHFPKDEQHLNIGLRYFKYVELLMYSTKMCLNHNRMRKNKDNKRKINRSLLNNILKTNNIKLTNDQVKVSKEIFNDIESDKTMYRLLIGDVGCGKTIVSALSLASICNNKYQGVLLCPTEILARQHFEFYTSFLKDYRICLLVSSLKNKENIKENIKKHNFDIVIGTTALIEEDVVFDELGIVVIDEQHRFGVKQRQKIIDKGRNVDVLYMSATPIPRSLALSMYGELDISVIKEFPNIERNVKSYVLQTNNIETMIKKIDIHLRKKQKIFIVCSLIEGEDHKRSAESIYNDLYKIYKDEVCLMHGKLHDDEKNEIIDNFRNNRFHILVSTTVIEVGIDIKDASIMIIFNANCYGLASLHQLRGRVGRNGQKAYCYFLCEHKKEQSAE